MTPAGDVIDPATTGAPAVSAPAPPAIQENAKQDKNRGRDNKVRDRSDRDASRIAAPDLQRPVPSQDRGLYVPNTAAPGEAGGDSRGRGKVKRESSELPPLSAPEPRIAPPPQAPRREMLQDRARERQAPPVDMAPPQLQGGPAAITPQGPPEGRGKPERGNKKRKDGEPEEP